MNENSIKKKNKLSSTTRVAFYPCFFHLWCHFLMVLPLPETVHCSAWWFYQRVDIIVRFQLSAFIITHKYKFEKQRRDTRNIFRSCYECWCCILPPTEASLLHHKHNNQLIGAALRLTHYIATYLMQFMCSCLIFREANDNSDRPTKQTPSSVTASVWSRLQTEVW